MLKLGILSEPRYWFYLPTHVSVVGEYVYDLDEIIPTRIWEGIMYNGVITAYYNKVPPIPPAELKVGMIVRHRTPLELAKVGGYIEKTNTRTSYAVCRMFYGEQFGLMITGGIEAEGVIIECDDRFACYKDVDGAKHVSYKTSLVEV